MRKSHVFYFIITTLLMMLFLPPVSAQGNSGNSPNNYQVVVCHIPPGNAEAAHTITVGLSALPAHFAHGDSEGECDDGSGGNNGGGGGNNGGGNGNGGGNNGGGNGNGGNTGHVNGSIYPQYQIGGDSIEIYVDPCTPGCVFISRIDIQTLRDALGTIAINGYIVFDTNLSDAWEVRVYYLGYQDRNGDGVSEQVFQINVYYNGELWNDMNLILIADDGSWMPDSN